MLRYNLKSTAQFFVSTKKDLVQQNDIVYCFLCLDEIHDLFAVLCLSHMFFSTTALSVM